ncbi:MAG: hypothetical protein RML72_01775, partial [Bacteroidia bacterium]|nr:hypothetical protein [Bacteroidia bacterium]MDW8157589.1 hypothetical protein [Bacteroidia bacterium]
FTCSDSVREIVIRKVFMPFPLVIKEMQSFPFYWEIFCFPARKSFPCQGEYYLQNIRKILSAISSVKNITNITNVYLMYRENSKQEWQIERKIDRSLLYADGAITVPFESFKNGQFALFFSN